MTKAKIQELTKKRDALNEQILQAIREMQGACVHPRANLTITTGALSGSDYQSLRIKCDLCDQTVDGRLDLSRDI
jgi:hypothetical protein